MSQKKARIKDIATMAGVSIGTVDRVIHNRGEVAEKTKTKGSANSERNQLFTQSDGTGIEIKETISSGFTSS